MQKPSNVDLVWLMSAEQFPNELGLTSAVSKQLTANSLTERDKTRLLDYLRKIHGAKDEKSKISLPHRQTSEIMTCSSQLNRAILSTVELDIKNKSRTQHLLIFEFICGMVFFTRPTGILPCPIKRKLKKLANV